MDGNRRWAKKNHCNLKHAYDIGAEKLEHLIEYLLEIGIKYMTCYALSKENVEKRSQYELNILYKLLYKYLIKLSSQNENISLRVIGDSSIFSQDIQDLIVNMRDDNKEFTLVLALNYSGRDDILNAVLKYKSQKEDVQSFNQYLYTNNIPDPDLLIRTSGEKRLSNFLLWQLAYTELYFTDLLWPDFTVDSLKEIIEDYKTRSRRFGV